MSNEKAESEMSPVDATFEAHIKHQVNTLAAMPPARMPQAPMPDLRTMFALALISSGHDSIAGLPVSQIFEAADALVLESQKLPQAKGLLPETNHTIANDSEFDYSAFLDSSNANEIVSAMIEALEYSSLGDMSLVKKVQNDENHTIVTSAKWSPGMVKMLIERAQRQKWFGYSLKSLKNLD